MNQIIVDETLRSKLAEIAQPVEFCDVSGRLLGRFLPAVDAQVQEWQTADQAIDRQGIQRNLGTPVSKRSSQSARPQYTEEELEAFMKLPDSGSGLTLGAFIDEFEQMFKERNP